MWDSEFDYACPECYWYSGHATGCPNNPVHDE